MNTNSVKAKWWKWGDPSKLKSLNDYPIFRKYLEDRWSLELKEAYDPAEGLESNYNDDIPPAVESVLADVPQIQWSGEVSARLRNATGKSYHDIIKYADPEKFKIPDAVCYPEDHQQVEKILESAAENGVVIIPKGGGTAVTGALDKEEDKTTISLDLKKMDKLLSIDQENLTATFQAGIFGPKLEDILESNGYTMGHFPQSFEYSTLGGWIVTRSAGQESSHYGKIEDIVVSVKLATPEGSLVSKTWPRHAQGVDLLPVIIGSEGTLGVVTEATVKIQPIPRYRHWIVCAFPEFNDGVEFLRQVTRENIHPSVVRYSDASETEFLGLLSSGESSPLDKMIKPIKDMIQHWNGLDNPCLMMMRFEETGAYRNEVIERVRLVAKRHRGFIMGNKLGNRWEESRFHLPYLRDTLIEHRVLIDTMETVVPWDQMNTLHERMRETLDRCEDFHGEKGVLLAHISHIYSGGACIYFTILTPMDENNPEGQWFTIKELVTELIVKHEGAVSHHHGVGIDHRRWYKDQLDPLEAKILKSIKSTVDPAGIMNPGKLFS